MPCPRALGLQVPIGYTIKEAPDNSDYSQVQCYFPPLGTNADVNQTCLGGRQHTHVTSVDEQPSTEEWAIFFATYEPTVDQVAEDWNARMTEDTTTCMTVGLLVLLIYSALESKQLCCTFCNCEPCTRFRLCSVISFCVPHTQALATLHCPRIASALTCPGALSLASTFFVVVCGVPIPFKLTDYRSRRGKFFKAAGVLGMFAFREAIISGGEESSFGSDFGKDFSSIVIFTALVSGEGSSRALAGSAVGLAYTAFLLYIMSAHLDHLAQHPQYSTWLADIVPYTETFQNGDYNETRDEARLAFYKSFRWTSNMASWATLTILFVFLTVWYLVKVVVYSHRYYTMPSDLSAEPTATGGGKRSGGGRELRRVSASLDMPWNKEHVMTLLRGLHATEFALKTNSGVGLHHSLAAVPSDDEDDGDHDDDGPRKLIQRAPPTIDDARELRKGDHRKTGCWNQMCAGFQNWTRGRVKFMDACSNCVTVANEQWRDYMCCIDGGAAWRRLTRCCRRTTATDPALTAYRHSTRMLAAISAALAYVLLVTVQAVYYVNVKFAHGVLKCGLSVKYGRPGLGTSRCDVYGNLDTILDRFLRLSCVCTPPQIPIVTCVPGVLACRG